MWVLGVLAFRLLFRVLRFAAKVVVLLFGLLILWLWFRGHV